MTVAKIDSKPASAAGAGLEPWVQTLYATPGKRIVGVVELRHAERTQPAPEEDKEPSVKLRITQLEIAHEDQADAVREALLALNVHRTAYGTLTEDGELELSKETLQKVGGRLHALEAARLRAELQRWWVYARNVAALGEDKTTITDLRGEVKLIADGLEAVLHAVDSEQG